jgi:cobyrinic acid a,c-diamide synthase
MMKKICIAGTQSGVGKTTVTMAILAALSKTMRVQPFKVGPDYIDPMFHSLITGNKSRNLDSYLMSKEVINYLFMKHAVHSDIAVIEGVMGLFDGASVGSDIGTTASIAKMTKTPVILVVDGSKVAASIAAVVKGFELFDPQLKIVGVICNKVSGEGHYQILKEAIELHTHIEPIGYLTKDMQVEIPERHLGLVPTEELIELEQMFERLANMASKTIDLDRLLQLAKTREISLQGQLINSSTSKTKDIRIAYAKDEAFHFYYQDNLDYLKDQGVELLPFSPMRDQELPVNINGLMIGGGFPEMFAKELAGNLKMKESIQKALEKGLPYYAECGGLMYLCQELYDLEGHGHRMVDWFQGKTSMQKSLQRFGYAQLTLDQKCIFGEKGAQINVHEFHRSKADIKNASIYRLNKEKHGQTVKQWQCGFAKGAGVGSYAHIHFYSNLDFAHNFVESCRIYKDKEE